MLQAIRTRAGSTIVKILFGILILSFGSGIWQIGDMLLNRTNDTTVAKIGDRAIEAPEFQTTVQQALERIRAQTGRSLDMQQAKQLGVIGTVLDQMIDNSLIDQEVARLRLDLSDDVVRAAIFQDPNFRTPTGGFDRPRFDEMLAMNHLNEEQFVAKLREGLPRSQMLHAVTVGASAPAPLVDAIYRYRNEKRVADIVSLPAAKAADPGQPSEADLEKFYQQHKEAFRAPEYRAFVVASLDPKDVAKGIQVSPEQLEDAYKERADELRTPERRDVQQILAPSEAKAKEAKSALKAGRDWQDVATTIAGQKPDTIDLGLVRRQDLPAAIADTAFELPLNTPSQPIKTPFGWQILRVAKIEPATTESFAQAKPELLEKLALRQALDRIYKLGNQVDDALAGGATLEEAAKKFGLKLTKIAAADEAGRSPDDKPVALPLAGPQVIKLVFDTEKGRTSRVTDLDEGGIFVVRVDGVTPSQIRPLVDVKAKAVAAWQTEQRRKEAAKQAEALKTAVAPGGKLAEAAKAKGLAATTSPPLGRSPTPADKVPPALVARIFGAKPGDVVTAESEAGSFVAQLDKVETPPAPPAATKELAGELTTQMRADLTGELTAALRRRFPVTVNRAEVDRLF